MEEDDVRRRWRLVLGRQAEHSDTDEGRPSAAKLTERDQALDEVLEFLFDREYAEDQQTLRDQTGGKGGSKLSVPQWLGRVRELFPKSTAESLARLALDRYQLAEILTDESILDEIEPNIELLRSLLAIKEVVPEQILSTVRRLIRKIVEELRQKLEIEIRRHFLGALHRHSRSPLKVSKNFDVETTLRKNLRNYQPEQNRLLIERAYFHSRLQRHTPWDLVLVVDQSGSMADSVVHSAVMAGIFRGLPMLRTHLVVFDAEVVDLTDTTDDPVEVLMRVQLGGGTDIAQAMQYADSLVVTPRRTIIVLVTDFYEGGDADVLVRVTAKLNEGGVTLLGLAALDERAEPSYDQDMARQLAANGMHIAAMTPDRLAEWVAERVRR